MFHSFFRNLPPVFVGDVCLKIAIFRTFHFSNFQNFRFQSSNIWVSYSNKWVLNWCMFLSFFSLENTLQVALGKCLGTAGTLRLPLVMPYRCIAPGEKESVNFTLKYNSSKGPQGKPCVLTELSPPVRPVVILS